LQAPDYGKVFPLFFCASVRELLGRSDYAADILLAIAQTSHGDVGAVGQTGDFSQCGDAQFHPVPQVPMAPGVRIIAGPEDGCFRTFLAGIFDFLRGVICADHPWALAHNEAAPVNIALASN
jgi:hypothetical protein